MTDLTHEPRDDEHRGWAIGSERPGMPAGRVLVVFLVTLLVWTLLYAPRMKEAAEAHPLGARRTASLIALAPFTALSDAVGLTGVTDSLERAVGLDPGVQPGGTIVLPDPDPLPSVTASPTPTPPSDAPPVETLEPIRTPARRDKLRVVIVGDSLAAGVGYIAGRVFRPSLVDIQQHGRVSTGLARPDYFDWFAAMGQIVQGYDPDLVLVMIGENDFQSLQTPSGKLETPSGTPDWPLSYQERAEALMRIATQGGARVVWIGLPVQREPKRWKFIQRQNRLFEEASTRVGDVAFLDAWELFNAPDGGYTAFYREGGRVEEIREADGLHFTATGYELLVREVAELATQEFGLDPIVYSE
jgi:lysophospholipase L1-like esterase